MSVGPIVPGNLPLYALAELELAGLQEVLQLVQQSLSTGDLAGAQTALNAYRQIDETAASATNQGASPQRAEIATTINALATALSSGNLADARQALSILQRYVNRLPPGLLERAAETIRQANLAVVDRVDITGASNLSVFDTIALSLAAAYSNLNAWHTHVNTSPWKSKDRPRYMRTGEDDSTEDEEGSSEDEPEEEATGTGEKHSENDADPETDPRENP